MKQQRILLILAAMAVLLITTCTDFFDYEEEGIKPFADVHNTTIIYFDNVSNNCIVEIYSTPGRTTRITTANARQPSAQLPWVSSDEGFPFYFTYYLKVPGIYPEKTIPFIPEKYGYHFVLASVKKNTTTGIKINNLKDGGIPLTARLFDDTTYVFVKNNNNSTIQLVNGSTVLTPVGETSTFVGGGDTALYEIDPKSSAYNYKLIVSTLPKDLSTATNITAFESGYLYTISVSNMGVINKDGEMLLTLNNCLQ